MTDTTITQGFIEMVKAYEAKPELEAKIVNLTQDVEFFERNLRIEEDFTRNLRETIAKLEASLAEVKKERDDAMFRSLELDEKLSGIEKLLGVAERLEKARREEHQATVDALTPTPLVEAAVVTEQGSTIIEPSYPGPIDPVVVEPQGQSVVDPMTVGQPENDTMISKDGPQTQSEPKINPYSGFPIHYPDGEYRGQPYYDKPSWISWAAFVDAGGEPEPYMQLVR